MRRVLISAAVLVPCYWQPRIQAGDLGSHIYNAWLAQLIESGRTTGLRIAPQTTNVLFDLLLAGWLRLWGSDWAQRVAVSLAVLIFVWGAFAFLSAVAGGRPRHMLPCIAMLAYGWVFHMGFFNFYLSLGLCFWALAMAWESMWGGRLRPRRAPWPAIDGSVSLVFPRADGPGGTRADQGVCPTRRMPLAAAMLLLAYTAHALPVLWAVGLMAYVWAARRLSPAARVRLLLAVLGALAAMHLLVRARMFSVWSISQLSLVTGADQAWVFDAKYGFLSVAMLLIWAVLALEMARRLGWREMLSDTGFQLCALSAGAVALLPGAVLIPGYQHALVYIAERMSLPAGVCICAVLSLAKPRGLKRYGPVAVALVYFGFLFHDERALNRFEDRMSSALAELPAGQRVVSPIVDPGLRVNALAHTVDRACLGRCYSFANYEPSTAQFRIRAVSENPFVVKNYGDSWDLQNGRHVVREDELPMFKIAMDPSGQMSLESLKVGSLCGSTLWEVLQNRAPRS